MLGRLYTILFLGFVLGSLWYQRHYLDRSANEFHAQIHAEKNALPVFLATHFQSIAYEQTALASALSGESFTYFSDRHFQAFGSLFYQEYGTSTEGKGPDRVTWVKSDQAFGEFLASQKEGSTLFSGFGKLNTMTLPRLVQFHAEGFTGHTSAVHFYAHAGLIKTDRPVHMSGLSGNMAATGFSYKIKEGSIVFPGHVSGRVLPSFFKEH